MPGVVKPKTVIRVIAYLPAYIGVPVLASIVKNQTVGSVLAIVYILLLIPFGILRLIDFYRTNDGTTRLSRAFNVLFCVPLALFGLVCVLLGLSMIGWVLYNVLIEHVKEYTGPRFLLGLGSFGIGVPLVMYGWWTLRSAFRRKEEVLLSPQEQEEFEREEDDEEPRGLDTRQ